MMHVTGQNGLRLAATYIGRGKSTFIAIRSLQHHTIVYLKWLRMAKTYELMFPFVHATCFHLVQASLKLPVLRHLWSIVANSR